MGSDRQKNPYAVELGRKGGKARTTSTTPEQRREWSRRGGLKGSASRWGNQINDDPPTQARGKSMSGISYRLDVEGARPPVVRAVKEVKIWLNNVARIKNPTKDDLVYSISMPCRIGKSDVLRLAPIIGMSHQLTAAGMGLTPGISSARQLVNRDRLTDFYKRWDINLGGRKHDQLETFSVYPFSNNEWMVVFHAQALIDSDKLNEIGKWVPRLREEYNGARPIILVDETHRFSLANHWGRIPRRWVKAGGLALVVTGSAFRHDGADSFGFDKVEIARKGGKKVFFRPDPDPDYTVRVDADTEVTTYEIKPDCTVTYKEGWDGGYICEPYVKWIDPLMEDVYPSCQVNSENEDDCDPEDRSRPLSQVPASRAKQYLHKICRHPIVIDDAVKHLIETRNTVFKNIDDVTFVVYGLNDLRGEPDNAHLNDFKNELLRQWPDCDMRIATLKQNEEGEEAAELIASFTDRKRMHFDGLGCKQMAGDSIDSVRICIVVILHNIRSHNTLLQQAFRGGTRSEKKAHCCVIMLRDKLSEEFWEERIRKEGCTVTEEDILNTKETRQPKKEPTDRPDLNVRGINPSGAHDRNGLSCTEESYNKVIDLFKTDSRFLRLLEGDSPMTIPDIAAALGDKNKQDATDTDVESDTQDEDDARPAEPDPVSTSEELDYLTEDLNSLSKKGASLLFWLDHQRWPNKSDKNERDTLYGQYVPTYYNRMKREAGVPINLTWDKKSPKRCRHVPTLRKIQKAANRDLDTLNKMCRGY